jgi:hypothetical protein
MQPGRAWKESRFNRLFIYIKCLCRSARNSKSDRGSHDFVFVKTASFLGNQMSHRKGKTKYGCWNQRLTTSRIINVDIKGQINRYTLRFNKAQSFKIRYSIILRKEFIRKYFTARIAATASRRSID